MNILGAYGLLILGQASIGINVTVGKYALQEMPTYVFLGLRFFLTAVFLTLLTYASKTTVISTSHPTGKLEGVDWGYLSAQALTGGLLFNVFFFWGLEYTTATSAGIIGSTLPAVIALFAYFFLREVLTFKKIAAIILAMLGIGVISSEGSSAEGGLLSGGLLGDCLILLAMVPEALYSIFNKFIGHRVTPLGSGAVVGWLMFIMVLPFSGYSWYTAPDLHLASFSLNTWLAVILTGMTSSLFFWAWPKGLMLIPTSTAGLFGSVMPVVTSLMAYFLLDEDFGWFDAIGMSLVFASLFVGTEWQSRIMGKSAVRKA